jgi:hypothetical protein
LEIGLPWLYAHVAQMVEHILGKDGVTSSILVVGSEVRIAALVDCQIEINE